MRACYTESSPLLPILSTPTRYGGTAASRRRAKCQPLGAIAVLGFLYLFFMYVIVKPQLMMKMKSQKIREPRFAATKSAPGPVRPSGYPKEAQETPFGAGLDKMRPDQA